MKKERYSNSDVLYRSQRKKNIKTTKDEYICIFILLIELVVISMYLTTLITPILIDYDTLELLEVLAIGFLFIVFFIFGIIVYLSKYRGRKIMITSTRFIYLTPLNFIPMLEKNRDIKIEQIDKIFIRRMDDIDYILITLKDGSKFDIHMDEISDFRFFIKLLKDKFNIEIINEINKK